MAVGRASLPDEQTFADGQGRPSYDSVLTTTRAPEN